jgi:hypothetical protein
MINRPFEAPVKIVTFFNDTDLDFVGMWDKVEYPIAAGEKMRMEDWKARHFAKHLFDQWCFANGKDNRRKEHWAIEKMASYIIESGNVAATSSGDISKLRTELFSDGVVPSYPKESDQIAAQRIVKQQPEVEKKRIGRPPKLKDAAPQV